MHGVRRLAVIWGIALLATPGQAPAQGPPDTDIYLADLSVAAEQVQLSNVRNITERPGYDNQPFFLPDSRGLFYTVLESDGQTEVYLYELRSGKRVRLTQTPESEYSPTPIPGTAAFSTVRVEKDSLQRLWQFPLRTGAPHLLLPHIEPVGYHAWLNADTVALFVLGEPVTLQIADLRTGRVDTVAERIGRSLHRVPGRQAISFVHKVDSTRWIIKLLTFPGGRIGEVIATLPGSEDYCWAPDGSLFMGMGSVLYRFRPGADRSWREVADLRSYGIGSITRLAVSPDGRHMALVAAR